MPCNTADMLMVHRVFRREFTALPQLVTSTRDGDLARAAVVARHLDLVLDLLHHHHETEDELLWPLLHERAPDQRELFAAMTAEHADLVARVDAAREAATAWGGTAEHPEGVALADRITDLARHMTEHLQHEERAALPVCARVVDQPEWNRLGERALGALGPAHALLVLAAMHEDSTDQEWQEFHALLPAVVAAAYDADGAAQYRTYITEVRSDPSPAENTMTDKTAVADAFFAAAEQGDTATLRTIYSTDATIWHNDGNAAQTVEENLALLDVLLGRMQSLRYEVKRRHELSDGLFQTHVLHAVLPDGDTVELDAAMYMAIADGQITRIEEYLDTVPLQTMIDAVGGGR
jgi:ketosteroid isomerase-like protein/hemerythrin-like domain-containing protein